MENQSPNTTTVYDTTIRLFILTLIVGWCLMILYPFVSIILWSLILALAIHPLHSIVARKMGGKPKLASFIIIFSILLVIVFPSWLLIDSLVNEFKVLKAAYDSGSFAIPPPNEEVKSWPVIGNSLYDTWYSASENLEQLVVKYKEQFLEVGSYLGKGILSAISGVAQIALALVTAARSCGSEDDISVLILRRLPQTHIPTRRLTFLLVLMAMFIAVWLWVSLRY
jgi:predicted PurR-regulated permease PerM